MPAPTPRAPFKIRFEADITTPEAIADHAASSRNDVAQPCAVVCAYRANYGVNLYLRAGVGQHCWFSPLIVMRDHDPVGIVQQSDRRYAFPIPRDENVPRVYAGDRRLMPREPISGIRVPVEEVTKNIKEVVADALAASN